MLGFSCEASRCLSSHPPARSPEGQHSLGRSTLHGDGGRGKEGEVLPKLAESCSGCWCSARKSCAWVTGGREGGVCVCRGAANVLGGNGGGRWCAADLVLHMVCTLTSLWCELGGCPCRPWVAFGVAVPPVSSQLALAKGTGAPGRVSPPAPRDGAGGRQTRGWCLRSLLIL